jgi:hypothetical protein
VIEAQCFGFGTCSPACKRQHRGATNVAGVPTFGAPRCPRFSEHVQRAGDVVCGRVNFFAVTVSACQRQCPEQSPNFCHASYKAGQAIDGLRALSGISRRNDNNSGPSLAVYPNAPRILPANVNVH